MQKKMMMLIVIVLALGVLSACGKKDEIFPPEAIQEGIDRCEVCNMLVSNDHHATQLVLQDGRSLKFDDIGDMFAWVKEHGLDDVNVRYVRDYHTEDWLLVEEATFVYDADFRTPMAYGVLSFQSKDEAEQFIEAEGKGKLLSYEELQSHSWAQNMDLMDHDHGHDHGDEEHNDHEHGDEHDDAHDHDHGDGDQEHHGPEHGTGEEHKE